MLHEEKMFVEITEGRTNFNKKHNLGRLDGFLFPLETELMLNVSQYTVKVQPTDVTYSILERWKEVKAIDPTIEYPDEAIQNQDWQTVSESLRGSSDGSTRIYPSLQEYIASGEIHEEDTVEELVEKNKRYNNEKE
ncbi:Uncharacterised protein [Niallia circulans]|nr:Uncharacterised protein [Niallia circulans]